MFQPDKLVEIIEKAHIAIIRHPQRDLNLGYRQAIWAAMGPHVDASRRMDTYGLLRRTALATVATQHVLPIWESVWPHDHSPQSILAEAEQVLQQIVDKRTAWKDRQQFWVMFLDLGNENEQYQIVSAVGFSAVQALTTAIQDERFDQSNIDYSLTDTDIDPDEMDSSFFAAAAYANGPIWEADSDATKRQEFWEWWLNQAVPSAWNSVS